MLSIHDASFITCNLWIRKEYKANKQRGERGREGERKGIRNRTVPMNDEIREELTLKGKAEETPYSTKLNSQHPYKKPCTVQVRGCPKNLS